MTKIGCKRDPQAKRQGLRRAPMAKRALIRVKIAAPFGLEPSTGILARKRLRKVSKSPKRQKELREDREWAKAVRDRAGNRCEYCGRHGTQAAHIVGRRNKVLRHNSLNGVALCPTCHDWADNQDPAAFREWLKGKFPDRWAMIAKRFE